MTDKVKRMLAALAALAALGLGGSALAGAASGGGNAATQESGAAAEAPESGDAAGGKQDDESDKPVTGDAAKRASDAAAAKVGGKPGAVERDTEKGAAYEVEVTKADGSKADVRLDDQFKVVAVEADNEQDSGKGQAGE